MKLSWSCRFCNDSGPRSASVGTRLSLFPFNFTSWNKKKRRKELLPTTFIMGHCSSFFPLLRHARSNRSKPSWQEAWNGYGYYIVGGNCTWKRRGATFVWNHAMAALASGKCQNCFLRGGTKCSRAAQAIDSSFHFILLLVFRKPQSLTQSLLAEVTVWLTGERAM